MNKYLKLMKNVSIFAIGTFTSKLLVFFLMPFYTRMLSTDAFGVANYIVDTATFIIPLATICITDAVIRFGLDRAVEKEQVFTNGLVVILAGFGVFLLILPVLLFIPILSEYIILIYLFVLCSSVNSLCLQFIRAKGYIKLFAYSGIQNTVIMVIGNVVMLGFLRWGIYGYVLSIVIADFFSTIFLFWIANLKSFLNFKAIDKSLLKSMTVFSLPLVPTAVFWWINTLAGRYIIIYMIGKSESGLYSAASKVPNLIMMIAGVIMQAWNISAVIENDAADRKQFYKNVFSSFSGMTFIIASLIILLTKPIMQVLVSDSFFESWKYVPLLTLGIVFYCFSSFLASIYMVAKKNKMSMVTILIGAVVNIALNFLLIPFWGVSGAAFSTFVSCLLVFILRVFNTKRFIRFDMQIPKVILNTVILIFQTVLMMLEVNHCIPLEITFFAVLFALNIGTFVNGAKRFMEQRKQS